MQWNDLSFDVQQKVYARMEDLLLRETDEELQVAIVAAMEELETWDNSPCKVVESKEDWPYVAQAVDPYGDN
jgi:hypothetical protein